MSLADRCIHQFDSGIRSRGAAVLSRRPGIRALAGTKRFPGDSSTASPSTRWSWTGGSAASNWPSAALAPTMTTMRSASIFGQPSWPPTRQTSAPAARARSASCRWTRRTTTTTTTIRWIDLDDDDDDDDPPPCRAARPAAAVGRQESGRRGPPPKPKWQQQLTWTAADAEPENPVRAIARSAAEDARSLVCPRRADEQRRRQAGLALPAARNQGQRPVRQAEATEHQAERSRPARRRGRRRDSQSPAGLSRRGKP